MSTVIEDLSNNEEIVKTIITEENYKEISLDFSIPLDTRVDSVKLYCVDDLTEFIKRIVNIFSISESFVIQKYIETLCRQKDIHSIIRLELAKDFAYCKDSDDFFKPLSEVIGEILDDTELTTLKKVESVIVLMRCELYKDTALKYFLHILKDKNINSKYRYKIITSLKTSYDMRKVWLNKDEQLRIDKEYQFFDSSALFSFITNDENTPNTRILAGQSLLVKYDYNQTVVDILLSIGENDTVEYNTRADSIDVVLRYGNGESKTKASDLIQKLGKIGSTGEVRTIYENAQNAHGESIEKSAISCYEKIAELPLVKKNENESIDFEYVVKELGNLKENASITITRISLDNAMYTKFNCTLKTALVAMYSFISTQEHFEFLKNRLIEELESSSGICSSGIFERIMNTVSGVIDDMNITISFAEQITSNVCGRLNKMIRDILHQPCLHANDDYFCDCKDSVCRVSLDNKYGGKTQKRGKPKVNCGKCVLCLNKQCLHVCEGKCNENLTGEILSQMIIPSNKYNERKTFLKFFRCAISDIIEDMREEFINYIDEASFDMYMKRAILTYEGEN
jgi:hypothetical protein